MTTKISKQRIYHWQGKNAQGESIQGKQTALTAALLKMELRRRGFLAIKIRRNYVDWFFSKKINKQDITRFSRQIATLLTAGIPLVQALEFLKRSQNKLSMQNLIYSLKTSIEKGSAVAETLRRHPPYFNGLYYHLIAIGERSGTLDRMFDHVAAYKEKADALKRKIQKALFYPAAVILTAILVTVAMLVFVVPQFNNLFAGFGAELPAPTRFIINLSDFLKRYGWFTAGFLCVVIGSMRYAIKHSVHLSKNVDYYILKIPIIGRILVKAIIARFTRTLATTFTAGLPLTEALETVAGAAGNQIYTHAILQAREKIITGQSLQQALQRTQLFPLLVIQMIAVGEESGTLDNMLNKLASLFEEEVDSAVDNLNNLLEPVIMLILGVIIGGLVIAMYLPIFKLGSVVS